MDKFSKFKGRIENAKNNWLKSIDISIKDGQDLADEYMDKVREVERLKQQLNSVTNELTDLKKQSEITVYHIDGDKFK